jgi:phage-related protein
MKSKSKKSTLGNTTRERFFLPWHLSKLSVSAVQRAVLKATFAPFPVNASCRSRSSELRVHREDRQLRGFVTRPSEEVILVVHAFAKKTQQTAPADIKLARKRLKEMLDDKQNQENCCSTSRGNCQGDWIDRCGLQRTAT